jgi:hypothetical protein
MLLKRLKVLLQTAQENCVEPTRISAAEGIQYWLGTCWPPPGATVVVVTVDGAAVGAAKPALPQGGAIESEMLTSGSACSWNRKLLWLLLLLLAAPPL